MKRKMQLEAERFESESMRGRSLVSLVNSQMYIKAEQREMGPEWGGQAR